jgi:hypothetical protein
MRSILFSKVHRYSTALFFLSVKATIHTNTFNVIAFAPPPSSSSSSIHKALHKRTIMSAAAARKKKEEYPPIPHVPNTLIPEWFNQERTKILTTPSVVEPKAGQQQSQSVYYWMQRDMRTEDNWALLYAEYLAKEQKVPLKVVYVLPPPVPAGGEEVEGMPSKVCEMNMTERHGTFLLGGLKIVEGELHEKNVPFQLLTPRTHAEVGQCIHACVKDDASVVICDMSPLRQYREWMESQAAPLFIESGLPLFQVDAHNVVPVWFASPKREVGGEYLFL